MSYLEEKNIFFIPQLVLATIILTHKAGVVATASHSDNKTWCDILMTWIHNSCAYL